MGCFVLGMHRSGTSAVTEALASIGFELPPTEFMVGGNDSNPHGHFEVDVLTEFNEAVLGRFDASWAAPSDELAEGLSQPAALGAEAQRVFRTRFETDDWLFKDPRLCLLMPVWRAALGDHPTVLVLRNPIGVAASLQRRNGLPLKYGLGLWERYLRTALGGLSGMSVHVASYGELLAGRTEELLTFAKAGLGDLVGSGGSVDGWLTDPSLVTHDVDEGAALTDDRLTEPQRQLLEALVNQRGTHGPYQPPDLGPETPGLSLAFRALASAGPSGVEEVGDRVDAAVLHWVREAEGLRTRAAESVLALDEARHGPADMPTSRPKRVLWAALGTNRYGRLVENPGVQEVVHRARQVSRPIRRLTQRAPQSAEISPRTEGLVAASRAGRYERPLTVIVPIHNAVDEVARCLDSLEANTPANAAVVLIDDASTDPRMDDLLDRAARRPSVRLLRNTTNLGFTRSVNLGFAEAPEGDVIVLNSDTEVTPRWTARLRNAAFETPDRATSTAISNAAGEFSIDASTPTSPDHAADIAVNVARTAGFVRPESPTANGFCMLITAEARALVPSFDAEGFPRGYGEENDFCMRLDRLGLRHVIADDCLIYHAESASFGSEKDALIERAMVVLDERYPDYHERARAFVSSDALAAVRKRASEAARTASRRTRRVLHVIHDGHGGTEFHVDDLNRSLSETTDIEPFRLMARRDALVLDRWEDGVWRPERQWIRPEPWDVRQLRTDRDLGVAIEVLVGYDIDVVHVHHLAGHTFDLVDFAAAQQIPLVLTVHDFYVACPSLNLLDDRVQFCGGVCTPGEGTCQVPELWISRDLPLKHRFAATWREATAELLERFDRVICPSDDTHRHLRAVFGAALPPVDVIEHGRDVQLRTALAHWPDDDEPIRLLLTGAIGVQKGGASVADLAREGVRRRVAVELLGELDPQFAGSGVPNHGMYDRERLSARLAAIRPTFIGVLSPWPETHCYVVSEAWANGIPVVVGPLGAQAERVRSHGGGIVCESLDPEAVIDAVVRVGRDPVRYAEAAAAAERATVRPVVEMADDHMAVYDQLW